MAKNLIDDLVDELKDKKPETKRTMGPHSFNVDVAHLREMQAYCKAKGVSVSYLINRFMKDFVETLQHTGELQGDPMKLAEPPEIEESAANAPQSEPNGKGRAA